MIHKFSETRKEDEKHLEHMCKAGTDSKSAKLIYLFV